MIGQNGPIFIFAAMIVNFVIALGQIVAEKEFKLRESMKIMGLYVLSFTSYNTDHPNVGFRILDLLVHYHVFLDDKHCIHINYFWLYFPIFIFLEK